MLTVAYLAHCMTVDIGGTWYEINYIITKFVVDVSCERGMHKVQSTKFHWYSPGGHDKLQNNRHTEIWIQVRKMFLNLGNFISTFKFSSMPNKSELLRESELFSLRCRSWWCAVRMWAQIQCACAIKYVYSITWGNNSTACTRSDCSATILTVIRWTGPLWPLKLLRRTTLLLRHSNHLRQVTVRNVIVVSPKKFFHTIV